MSITLAKIAQNFQTDVDKFVTDGSMSENLFNALYDYYSMNGEMPYGVAKARTGDPYEWVAEQFEKDIKDLT